MADDYGSTTATAGTGRIHGAVLGSIEAPQDRDWFRLTLEAGTTYSFRLLGAPSGRGTLADPFLMGIHDAHGELISFTANDDWRRGLESRVDFTPPHTGTYYVAAGSYGSGTGSYELRIGSETLPDVPANPATTAAIAPGGIHRGLVGEAGDRDWIAASLQGGRTYVIELAADASTSNPLPDPLFAGIHDAAGMLLAGTVNDDYGTGLDARVAFTPTEDGTYYLAAGGYGGWTGSYALRLLPADPEADDAGSDPETAARLGSRSQASGSIDFARDIDWFQVVLEAGTGYRITARGADSGAGTLQDPQIVGLYDAQGRIILGTGNDDAFGTQDASTRFTPLDSGTYYVAVQASGDATGSYRLVTEQRDAAGDIPANATTSAVLLAGTPQTSSIEAAGDADWFRMSLTAGTSYRIDLLGSANGDGTLGDPFLLGVYDAAGVAVPNTRDDDGGAGLNARVDFLAPQTGTFFVAAGAYGSSTGSYRLTLSATGRDTTAPTLQATSPADNASGVAPSANLSMSFSEAMRPGTGTITITGGGSSRSIDVNDSSQVSFSGTTVSINPTADLAADTAYAVTFGAGVVQDLAGNAFAGLGAGQFNFRTDLPGAQDSWTLMVYMAADNDLESFGIADLNEMESVLLPGNVNVRVLVDRAAGYSGASGNWTDTRTGLVAHDSNLSTVTSPLTSLGELNTGAAATLTDFINASVAASPASHYGLVIWNHGGGLTGTAWDDASGGDNLTLAEYLQAIDASVVEHFDLLGFDACLQGMVEQLADLADLADVFVASQELEPGDGWEYQTILAALAADPHASPIALGDAIVDAYRQRYAGEPDTTLASLRTDAWPALQQAIDGFVQQAFVLGAGAASALRTAAGRATPLNNADEDYRDLGDFMREVRLALPNGALAQAAQGVIDALDDAVLARTGTVAGANGLSIYLPLRTLDASYSQQDFSFVRESGWASFLRLMLNDGRNDSLQGTDGANLLHGWNGNDTIAGGGSHDWLGGGAGADSLEGGIGDDTLDGGTGIDRMAGGRGGDVYLVDAAGDVVAERSNEGRDRIESTVTLNLADTDGAGPDGGQVEELRLLGSAAINGFGNALDNVIYANAGVNRIDGGAGSDTVSFADATGAGSTGVTLDLGIVNGQGQSTAAGISGADLVRRIENITGSRHADTLAGNEGANVLDGGAGNDLLTGRGGADRFLFATALDATGVDTLADFTPGSDRILLADDIFAALGIAGTGRGAAVPGALFNDGSAPADAGDRLFYDRASGQLAYDADGSGAAAAVTIAIVGTATHPALAATDFLVVG